MEVEFNAEASEAAKYAGMRAAAAHRKDLLAVARDIARQIASKNSDCITHADEVQQAFIRSGYDTQQLGSAAGSIFKTDDWEFTNTFHRSARVKNHARLLMRWRLKGCNSTT